MKKKLDRNKDSENYILSLWSHWKLDRRRLLLKYETYVGIIFIIMSLKRLL